MHHTDFVHLHVHSEYSLLDGACRLKDLAKKAGDFNLPALAITDHGNMFGAVRFYQIAMKAGIKPILGCELYIAPGSRKEKTSSKGIAEASFHGTFLVKDKVGYKNLFKLISLAYIEGFYYKPRVDKELLKEYGDGLIFLTSCLKGEIPYYFLRNQPEKAYEAIEEYRNIFKEDMYLELIDNGLKEQKMVNEFLLQASKDFSLPIVATNDIHYLEKEDAEAHDALLCIQTGKVLEDKDRLRFSTYEFYFKSPQQMKEIFKDFPSEAIANTVEIAKICNLELDFGHFYLPHYETPRNFTLSEYLRRLCYEGFRERYKDSPPESAEERLKKELEVIDRMNYAGYFLIVWDLIKYAKEKNILVGPGRGSAAGSLVSYCLGITDIDPLKYNLLFERFLNPERISMPDIDIDFCYERRDEIIEYVSKKYGKDKVAQIITFGTMLARAVIRDVGRVLNLPYNEVDKIAKLIPPTSDIDLERAIQEVPELQKLIQEDSTIKTLFEIAKKLEGLVRHASTHAAGVVIAKDPLTDYLPLYRDPKGGVITTQFDKDCIEAIGLLKMDFLGLKTLTVIGDTIKLVKQNKNIDIDLANLPLDDKDTYRLLSEGNSIGIFQLESSGMRELLRKVEPTSFEDLIAILALYRPGPLNSGMLDEYVANKHGRSQIKYPHPSLKHILEETYGIIVYQEQVMRIASELAGFSMGQADELRRAMGKKIPEKMEAMGKLFIENAVKKGIPKEKAKSIFELMAKFAQYGFNKSHSAAYALISFRTAYLKTHYPVEFMASLLTSELNNIDKVAEYVTECKKMGIKVLPPDVNESEADFTVIGDSIRFGLVAVKNVGISAIKEIVKARQIEGRFNSIFDFCSRVNLRVVNRKVLESLIKCGAFDSTGAKRSQLFEVIDKALEVGTSTQKHTQNGQFSLFEGMEKPVLQNNIELPDIDEWHQSKRLSYEKELIGLYITGHPLIPFEFKLRRYADCSISELYKKGQDETVTLGGILTSIRRKRTKNGKIMAYLNLEDLTGSVEIILFPKIFEEYKDKLAPDSLFLIKGRVDTVGEGQPKVNAIELFPLPEDDEEIQRFHISVPFDRIDESLLINLRKILQTSKGKTDVVFHLIKNRENPNQEIVILLPPSLSVEPQESLFKAISSFVGEGSCWLEDLKS